MRTETRMLAAALVLCAGAPAFAQTKTKAKTAGPVEEIVDLWNRAGQQLVEMADEFPEAKYDYKPTPEVRTFAEQVLHAAGANMMFVEYAKTGKLAPEDLPRAKYKTKADIVAVLKKSVADGTAYIQQTAGSGKQIKMPFGPDRMVSQYFYWVMPVGHMAEHYGQLVVYYRLNKLVPPASRPKKATNP